MNSASPHHRNSLIYESDISVAFIICGPNIPKGIHVSDLTDTIDIAHSTYKLIYGDSAIPDSSVIFFCPSDRFPSMTELTFLLIIMAMEAHHFSG